MIDRLINSTCGLGVICYGRSEERKETVKGMCIENVQGFKLSNLTEINGFELRINNSEYPSPHHHRIIHNTY